MSPRFPWPWKSYRRGSLNPRFASGPRYRSSVAICEMYGRTPNAVKKKTDRPSSSSSTSRITDRFLHGVREISLLSRRTSADYGQWRAIYFASGRACDVLAIFGQPFVNLRRSLQRGRITRALAKFRSRFQSRSRI